MNANTRDAAFTRTALAIFEAWNRSDFDGWANLAHPEVEFRPEMAAQLEGIGGVYRGREGLRRFWDEFHDVWETVTVTVDEHEWVGERLLVVGCVNARGRHSGVPVNSPLAWLIEFDADLITRTWSFVDARAARDAAHRSIARKPPS
jgi:ketosteroid isomerase-like protein